VPGLSRVSEFSEPAGDFRTLKMAGAGGTLASWKTWRRASRCQEREFKFNGSLFDAIDPVINSYLPRQQIHVWLFSAVPAQLAPVKPL
jgi:hypothetical protein